MKLIWMQPHNPELHDRADEDQRYWASGLNLIVAAIVLWNTVYLGSLLGTERIARQGISSELDGRAPVVPTGLGSMSNAASRSRGSDQK